MKLLFDQNLSYKLVELLADIFPDSQHVRELNLADAVDDAIWEYAKSGGFIVVTKDEDFFTHSMFHGQPPKVIWIQTGNCATERVHVLLRRNLDHVVQFERSSETNILALL